MASAIKKVDTICQIVELKLKIKRWKLMRLRRRSVLSHPDSDSEPNSVSSSSSSSSATASASTRRNIPPGFLAVYVGTERRRFVIPTRYINLPIFISLLKKAEEEFGYQSHGALVLPCEVGFFKEVLKVLEKNEHRFRRLELDGFLKMFSEVGLDSCKDGKNSSGHGFTPLLQKARV